MGGDRDRVVDHLHAQLREAQIEATYYQNQLGEMRGRWMHVRDQLDAHMAEPHGKPIHEPAVAPTQREGVYGVYCIGCSEAAEDYVNPCQVEPDKDWPPAMLAAVPE